MLQTTPLSKVYCHSHFKKFWLVQNQKETENKALLASSASRSSGGSSGLGHESKQGSQFIVGNANARTLSTPPGLPVRPLVSGPACFNMARHASLVTCAESLSPSRMEQLGSSARPPSPNNFSSSSKEEKCYLAVDCDGMTSKSPRGRDANSVYTPQWDSSFGFGDQLVGDYRSPLNPKEERIDNASDGFSPSKDSRLSCVSLQEGYQHCKISDAFSMKDSSGSSKCNLGFFSDLETVTPFAVPFQLPERYFLEAEAKTHDQEGGFGKVAYLTSVESFQTTKSAVTSISPGRGELSGVIEGEARRDDGLNSTALRTCTVCGTSKTPLWRSGPHGPKSLCNACGIRFKKARRGSSESADCAPVLQRSPSIKSSLKAAKRKQDTPFINIDTHLTKSVVTNGVGTQAVKKRRWSQLVKKGEDVKQKGEVTGSSNESSLTWNLNSPSAVSSPSVSHFERLSIDEHSTALNVGAGKDEEEAAVLLMYMSWGLVFA
ncbi:hypothetical protein L7F22_015705 [Adiantum nelumboides]|nr:hypothetical protein [Adiantum nelumboides]